MKLSIDRLTTAPRSLAFEIAPAWWRTRVPADAGAPVDVDSPLAVELVAYRAAADVVLEGTVSGSVAATCSRCLARYRHALREAFRLVLEPAGERVPADPEGAASLARDGLSLGDELEAGWFRGNEIDLSTFLAEVVALALPLKPLCREDCAGLCPQCGADRNTAACSCAEAPRASPFAGLSALRDRAGGVGSGSGRKS
jgi:uncharacterized protein